MPTDKGGSHMSIMELGALGEFVGAFAVLVTLIYLTIQVRQNTKSLRSATYQSVSASVAEVVIRSIENEDLARIGLAGPENLENLDPLERFRADQLLQYMFRTFENFFYQLESGMMEDYIAEGTRNSMAQMFQTPYVNDWFQQRRLIFSGRFAEFLESLPLSSFQPDLAQYQRETT